MINFNKTLVIPYLQWFQILCKKIAQLRIIIPLVEDKQPSTVSEFDAEDREETNRVQMDDKMRRMWHLG